MAVNENLYNWIHKTYGLGAAEWYRNNPTAKPGANPHLPKGAYVPQAKGPQQVGPRRLNVSQCLRPILLKPLF
jgi:hypothetical protein